MCDIFTCHSRFLGRYIHLSHTCVICSRLKPDKMILHSTSNTLAHISPYHTHTHTSHTHFLSLAPSPALLQLNRVILHTTNSLSKHPSHTRTHPLPLSSTHHATDKTIAQHFAPVEASLSHTHTHNTGDQMISHST